MANQIRVKLNYSSISHQEIATAGVAVVDGLTNNPKLTNPPIPPADLKAQVETYASLIAAAANDGGKRAIIERDQQRAVVAKMLRQLGHWVEANCDDDPGILKSSGYQQASFVRISSGPLDGPPTFKLDGGPNSGQMILQGKPVPKAISYTVRYASVGSDGKLGTWTELVPVTSIRSISVNGLTPATTYAFQVRALGRLGYTDWSDSVTRISL